MSDVVGMCKYTGKGIGEAEHIQQSIDTILTTPKGTRVMRRDWGVSFLDQEGNRLPYDAADTVKVAQEFLTQEEPRINSVKVEAVKDGTGLRALNVSYIITSSSTPSTTKVGYPLSGRT